MSNVIDNSSWCLGDGTFISLWFDNWCGYPLCLDDDASISLDDQTINEIMVNAHCDFAKSSTNIPFSIQMCISNCHIPFDIRPDKRCWNHSSNGDLSLKSAYEFKRNRGIVGDGFGTSLSLCLNLSWCGGSFIINY